MAKQLTADDILPLIAQLPAPERTRLYRLISRRPATDAASAYKTQPPGSDEFGTDEDPLAWDAEGWETFG